MPREATPPLLFLTPGLSQRQCRGVTFDSTARVELRVDLDHGIGSLHVHNPEGDDGLIGDYDDEERVEFDGANDLDECRQIYDEACEQLDGIGGKEHDASKVLDGLFESLGGTFVFPADGAEPGPIILLTSPLPGRPGRTVCFDSEARTYLHVDVDRREAYLYIANPGCDDGFVYSRGRAEACFERIDEADEEGAYQQALMVLGRYDHDGIRRHFQGLDEAMEPLFNSFDRSFALPADG